MNNKVLFDWKTAVLAVTVTFLGLFYTEISNSKDWMVKTYGFPEYFYMKKSSGAGGFLSFGIMRTNYIHFVQNFSLFYLLINSIRLIFKKK
ncbi:hypothetical protein [Chryseobacterium sp. H1D6B]|uniref:hypothetical protein n=1 Tax=Chryseobacterium sp. H1D6B TaxID=2940588 RepID=UPI0015CED3B8|nr:hypothetical protein [Chryseobacterium sp. H1D6B]